MATPLQEPKLPPNPTIDDWLKLLGFDVNLLRSVKPGDYIFSTDHNMLVKTTKEIYNILELVNTKLKSIESTIQTLTTPTLPRPSGVNPPDALDNILKYMVENNIKLELTLPGAPYVVSDDLLNCPICHDSIADPTPLSAVTYENIPVNPTTAVPVLTGETTSLKLSTNYTPSKVLTTTSTAMFVVAVDPFQSDYSQYPNDVAWYSVSIEVAATKTSTYDFFLNVMIVGNQVRTSVSNIDLPASDFTYLQENLPTNPYSAPTNTWLLAVMFLKGAVVHIMFFDTSFNLLKHVVIDVVSILSGIGYTSVTRQSLFQDRVAVVDYFEPSTTSYYTSDVYIDYVIRVGGDTI